jgi:hypothetical protein
MKARIDTPSMPYLELEEASYESGLRIWSDIDDTHDYFLELHSRALESQDFYFGRQWTSEERTAHLKQGRPAWVMNEIFAKIEHLQGTQRATRFESHAEIVERGDAKSAELMTRLLKYTETMNNFEYIESEVYQSGLIQGASAVVIGQELSDTQYGYTKIRKVPMLELFWDSNSREYTMEDARWMARVMIRTRQDAIEMFPEYADKIEEANINPKARIWDMPYYRGFREYYTRQYSPYNRKGREFISVCEHYERVKKWTYIVYDEISGNSEEFASTKEAKDFLEGILTVYQTQGVEQLQNEDGSDRVGMVKRGDTGILQTIIVGDAVIYREWTALPRFPFVVYFPIFHEGNFMSYVDLMKDYQRQINRFNSQLDYQLGATQKSMMTVVPDMLARGFTMEDLRRERSKTGAVIPVQSHQAIQNIPPAAGNPELFQFMNYHAGKMMELAGGRETLGMTAGQGSHVPAKAVLARQEAAGAARLPTLDFLRMWRREVMTLVVWYLKNFTSKGQVFRLLGKEAGDIEVVELDDQTVHSLREIKFDIVIDEAGKTESQRQMYFETLLQYAQQVQMPPEIITPLLLEFSPLPESAKKELRELNEFYKEYTAKKAQMAQQQKDQAMAQRAIERQVYRDQAEQAMQQQQQGGGMEQPKDDTQAIQNALATQDGGVSPTQLANMTQSVQTPQEMQDLRSATLSGKLGVSPTT